MAGQYARPAHDGGGACACARDVVACRGPTPRPTCRASAARTSPACAVGGAAEALLLSPQGKVEALCPGDPDRADDAFVIDTDGGLRPGGDGPARAVQAADQGDIGPLDWACVAVRGPDAAASALVGQPRLVLPVDVARLAGRGPARARPPGRRPLGGRPPPSLWRRRPGRRPGSRPGSRSNGREVVEGTIPAEAGLVERTVSFTKGCFTGQELVARLDARGSKVARRPVRSGDRRGGHGGASAPPVGAAVVTADGSHQVGHLSSVAWSPGMGRRWPWPRSIAGCDPRAGAGPLAADRTTKLHVTVVEPQPPSSA